MGKSADVLIDRFSKDAASHRDKATAVAKEAIKEAKRLDDSSRNSDLETCKSDLGKAAAILGSLAEAMNGLVSAFNVRGDAPNAAAEYAQRALDLQVGKSGGLLAYNALGLTVATLMWTARAGPEWLWKLRLLVVVLLFVSSLLCLQAIIVRWPGDDLIGDATRDLNNVIKLARCRATAINWATLCAILGTVVLALWMGIAETAQQRMVGDKAVSSDSGIVIPIRLADTLHLRCVLSKQSSAQTRDWVCSVAPQPMRGGAPGK